MPEKTHTILSSGVSIHHMAGDFKSLRPIANGIADFREIRESGCIYVDKTAYFHRLISTVGTKLFFVSRPRRFGKSLMISTLRAIFEGRRELFDGLAIAKTGWKWEKFPVLQFDFSNVEVGTLEEFKQSMQYIVRKSLAEAGCAYDDRIAPAHNFANAIETLGSTERGVAILIDEYDAPVAHSLNDINLADQIRSALSSFYIQMKSRTGRIRFLMMTGVSKFTKLSVFSALNNIVDISLDDEYATMLGYTEEELTQNFDEHFRAHAERMRIDYDEYRRRLKFWYNGYRFAKYDPTTVYNPISIALTLFAKAPAFSPTWATTGRPSMLMHYLDRNDVLAISPNGMQHIMESAFDVADLKRLKAIPMLYQSGYLTIRDYEPETRRFTLGVPNEEVRQDLCLLMVGVAADEDVQWASGLVNDLLSEDWPAFFGGLKALYAAMLYGSTERSVHESSYARCLSFLLASCGFRFRMEDVQSDGRADVIAEHVIGTYIFELKVDEPVEAAFAQIDARGYAEPYRATGKPIWAIALSFDSASRRLADAAARQI